MLIPSHMQWVAASHDTRPADNFGTAVTPAQNAKGSWTTVMAGGAVIHDVWEIAVRINNLDITGISRNALVDIGYDAGAGFVVLIPNLLVSYSAPYVSGGFMPPELPWPLHIPAGAAIGARGSVDNANLSAFSVSVIVAGDPIDETRHYKGLFVRAFGAVEASSSGTVITPGTAAEGAWGELGTLADDLHFWNLGLGAADSTIGGVNYHLDVAIGPVDPPTKMAILNQRNAGTTAEQWSRGAAFPQWCRGLIGEKVFGRAQCSGAVDGPLSMIAYGVGGDGGNSDLTAPSDPVATTATTATAIRDALAAALALRTPGILPTHLFKKYDKELDFDRAMIQGPGHSFRVFQCRFDRNSAVPITRNGVNHRWRYTFHVRIAYPAKHYQDLDIPLLEIESAADDDQRLIQDEIWEVPNATWIKSESGEPTSETVDGVMFIHYLARFEFIRAMP